MIIVTGTKRSGTSMWMQILEAAGYAVLGEPFPRDWAATIRAANQNGFFESPWRHGVHPGTNPDPRTGQLLTPHATRRTAVKIFARGVTRTGLAYIQHCLVSLRHWREYRHSLERLYTIERANKLALAQRRGHAGEVLPSLAHPPAVLEWWHDNFTLLRDAHERGYPLRLISYDAVLREPKRRVREVLDWLGGGLIEPSVAAVQHALRTQHHERAPREDSGLTRTQEAVFDELYTRVDQAARIDGAFLRRLEVVHGQLAGAIAQAEKRARDERRRARNVARAALQGRAKH
jgi:hypothetical protein